MIKEKTAQLKELLERTGQDQHDKRFSRNVKGLNCHIADFSDCLTEKQLLLPEDKYKDDWVRMYRTFNHACNDTIVNQNSRQMVVLNTNNYLSNFQCFQLMQFIQNPGTGDYDVLVYQRSADIDKMESDLKFFMYVITKFEKKTYGRVSSFKVIYGNLHTTKK